MNFLKCSLGFHKIESTTRTYTQHTPYSPKEGTTVSERVYWCSRCGCDFTQDIQLQQIRYEQQKYYAGLYESQTRK